MVAEQLNLLRAADVQDQRIVLRPSLGFKNLGNSSFVQSVGAKTIDGFRGNGNKFAVHNQIGSGRGGDRVGRG